MPALSDLMKLRSLLVDMRRDAARRAIAVDADVVKWATETQTLQQLIEAIDRAVVDERPSPAAPSSRHRAATPRR